MVPLNTETSGGSRIWRGGSSELRGPGERKSPEAEVFSLNYMLILDFFEHDVTSI